MRDRTSLCKALIMTLNPAPDARLSFDIADRISRAMRVSKLSNEQAALKLEVHPNTISAWKNGRSKPKTRELRNLALATGFPLDWLETGAGTGPDTPPLHYMGGNVAPVRTLRLAADIRPIQLASAAA